MLNQYMSIYGGTLMSSLSDSIIDNVESSYIETYLKQKKHFRTEEEKGQALKYWVDNLLKTQKINVEEFEEFLFNELFWGKRKTIRVYKLENARDYKYPIDWEMPLKEKYSIHSIDFCDILNTIPTEKDTRKIAAIRSEENSKGELMKIRILFVFYIEMAEAGKYISSSAYVPVEIDFLKKIMLIKAWTRQHIAFDEHKTNKLIQHVKNLMEIEFKIVTAPYRITHKKVLFNMSKSLIYEVYSNISTYNQIGEMEDVIKEFIKETYARISLRNVSDDGEGQLFIPKDVLDFEGEIRNVLESLVISDYFFDRSYDEIWEMGLEAIVSRIKFNDKEKVLTSLNAEETEAPIFCTKTFMSLKNRMEETERIETLWIAMDRAKGQRGHLNLKFDASNQEYLEILVKYGIRFNESDMDSALKIYEKYESKLTQKIARKNKIAVGQ